MSFEGAGSGKHHRDKFYSCVVQKKKFLQKSVNVVEQGNGQKKWEGKDVAWWERGSAATTEQHVGGRDWNNVLRYSVIYFRTYGTRELWGPLADDVTSPIPESQSKKFVPGSLIGVKDSDFVGRPEAETP